ncbi:MAG: hypothetical protein EBS06_08585 [Proteobacteria bacterium]|nr:hypothetical protein [Pseudomonadota bacterium]
MFRKKSHKTKKTSHNFPHEIGEGIKNFEKKVEGKIEDIAHEIERDVKIVAKKIKKKIDAFYKVSFALLLTLSIILAYFVILVSTTPKSFPFVTKEIREQLKKNYGDKVTLEEAYISFTRYGTLKVSVNNLRIFNQNSALKTESESKNQEFLIPKAEAEFSLLNIIHSSFIPRTIKISNPEIVVSDFLKTTNAATEDASNAKQIELMVAALATMKNEKLLTKIFEIENAKLIFKSENESREILIKKSQIRTFTKDNILYISSTNKIGFSKSENSVDINSSCNLGGYNVLKCDLFLANFSPNSIADLTHETNVLQQIEANLNAGFSFIVDGGKFHNLTFKIDAKKGSFYLPKLFQEKMFFSDFTLKGEYDEGLGILDLSEIKTDFYLHEDADISDLNSLTHKTKFNMSLLISNLKDWQNSRFDFHIKLKDAPTNEVEKLWPVFLHDHGIKNWVIAHITNGMISDAYAQFSLIKNNGVTALEKINSELIFSDLDLKYSDDFPEITNINGLAKFTKKGMDIAILSADVLGSKIYDSKVIIDDFSAPTTMLKILGKSKGDASDSLKHADNNSSKFCAQVKKYLNGNSQNNFDIRIPLHDQISLKHTYIAVNSSITGLRNDYVNGAITAAVKKDLGSENFVTSINLSSAELNIKDFSITKKSDAEGYLNLVISFPRPKTLQLKNIVLSKKEQVKVGNKTQIVSAKISGEAFLETAPLALTSLDLKNENFGRNSFSLNYFTDKKTKQKISIRGQVLDLAPFIQNKLLKLPENDDKIDSSTIQIALDNLLLANSKSIRSFYFGLKCVKQFCYSGNLKGNYNKKSESLNLQLVKKSEENFTTIDGQITDVGYLAEALGISNIVAGGNAHIKLKNKIINQQAVLEGVIDFKNSIVIYENPAVKRLASNDLFSKVRDKIFSNNKTIFDSMKLEVSLSNQILDIKSLIANNYKIGITAKGKIDLKNDTYEIRGMIVPGFIINNLFGIGNIPIIGNVVGLLTGGEGGGLFGIRYQYIKKKGDREATFTTNKISSFVPTTIKNLFDLI